MVEPVAAVRDGMGLADRDIVAVADSFASGIANKQQFASADSGHTVHRAQLVSIFTSFFLPSKVSQQLKRTP